MIIEYPKNREDSTIVTHNYNHLIFGRERWKTYNGDQNLQQMLLGRQGVHIQNEILYPVGSNTSIRKLKYYNC